MSKIAIVGSDASGKTVFVSALTDYYKAGQRIGQSCAMIAADTFSRRYTDSLHYTMRILHQWPQATAVDAGGVRRLKWTMTKDGKPFTEIQMLDYGGENFRYAFRDDGTTRNAAVVEELVNYIAEADFIVITVGLDNMVRALTPEVYGEMEDGAQAHELDSESQWITNGLLKLVKAKMETKPPGVVVALTQADKHRSLLNEYGGAKALFARCWADIDTLYPELNVVAVASVDRLTAGGLPADDYKTDGVLTVMKEFSRYVYGDCDALARKLDTVRQQICNLTDVSTPEDFLILAQQYEQTIKELFDKTAIVQDLYKDTFQTGERFLSRCKQFIELLTEVSRRSPDSQAYPAYWAEQARLFPDFGGTIRGFTRFYQRRMEQTIAEERRAQEAAKRREEERLQQMRMEEERIQMQREAEAQARKALELQRQKAAEEQARIERERIEREGKTKAFTIRLVAVLIILLIFGGGVVLGLDFLRAKKQTREAAERERIEKITSASAVDKAKADAQKAESERQTQTAVAKTEMARQATAEAEARRKEEERRLVEVTTEAEAKQRQEEENARQRTIKEEEQRRIAKQIGKLKELVSEDNLSVARTKINELNNENLGKEEKSVLRFCEVFCDRLEQAQNGDAESQIWIADLHADPKEVVSKDRKKAFEWYLKAAGAGKTVAMLKLADWCAMGIGTSKDESRAFAWYLKAANAGSATAMQKLYHCYANGVGTSRDETMAIEWLIKAAEATGDSNSMFTVAQWYRRLAEESNHSQTPMIGNGKGIESLTSEMLALEWYAKAARKGNANAFYWIGTFYAKGSMGIVKDKGKANACFEWAKDNGCTIENIDDWIKKTAPTARIDTVTDDVIVEFYTKQDLIKTVEDTVSFNKYLEAAKADDARAMFNVAKCYEKGTGILKDESRALMWYSKAASGGNGNAMYWLGVFYAKGTMGLVKSKAKAHVFFLAAKDNGCTLRNVDEWIEATKAEITVVRKGFWGKRDMTIDDLLNEIDVWLMLKGAEGGDFLKEVEAK